MSKEDRIEKAYRKNYINNIANLITDNIASIYKVYGNNHNLSFNSIFNMSQDTFILTDDEIARIDKLVLERLRINYSLIITSQDKKNKLDVKRLK